MSVAQLTAGTVMNSAASLNNDSARSIYPYSIQVPYLNMAMKELQEYFELHNISSTQLTSAVIQMDAGDTEIIYDAGVGIPELPDDMIEPAQLWERNRGIDPFIPMTKRDYLPHNLEGVETNQFVFFVWENQTIKVLPSNQNNDIKIDYIKTLFSPVTSETSDIDVINAETFLEYRTGGLLAEFVGENKTRADSLNAYAALALDRATGIGVKGKQTIMTRRRPFRSSYKRRGWMT